MRNTLGHTLMSRRTKLGVEPLLNFCAMALAAGVLGRMGWPGLGKVPACVGNADDVGHSLKRAKRRRLREKSLWWADEKYRAGNDKSVTAICEQIDATEAKRQGFVDIDAISEIKAQDGWRRKGFDVCFAAVAGWEPPEANTRDTVRGTLFSPTRLGRDARQEQPTGH